MGLNISLATSLSTISPEYFVALSQPSSSLYPAFNFSCMQRTLATLPNRSSTAAIFSNGPEVLTKDLESYGSSLWSQSLLLSISLPASFPQEPYISNHGQTSMKPLLYRATSFSLSHMSCQSQSVEIFSSIPWSIKMAEAV